jgi:NADH-quinone oxidoreductase subunit F
VSGGEAIEVRALKRFVTDCIDPAVYRPARPAGNEADGSRVAVIGSGPAGISAAHYLSLQGQRVTLFEAEQALGGMLIAGIPAYRLPRALWAREIAALLDGSVEIRTSAALGRDFTLQSLVRDGFKAVFLALGAHRSRRLGLDGEDLPGVVSAMQFLKAFNLRGKSLARGHVGVIGGGNSAIDAARVALRQDEVKQTTILYRRTRGEMPAFNEEIEDALDEGIALETLVSPVRILSSDGRVTGLACIRNRLGERDSTGRRPPVPIPGTEFTVPLDTIIIAVGEEPDLGGLASMGLECRDGTALRVDPDTYATNLPGVFAGGDMCTGPHKVVEAIAAGKRAAETMGRFVRGETLGRPPEPRLPEIYIEAPSGSGEDLRHARRAPRPVCPSTLRKRSFAEVEMSLPEEDARREARRCLRCDLEFTQPKESESEAAAVGARRA